VASQDDLEEEQMKNQLVLALVMVVAGMFAGSPVYAQDACTNLQGSYGFSRSGTAASGTLSVVAAGVLVFDGAGNVSGHDTTSVNGNIIRRTFSGTYTLNSDCTGSMTITFLTGTPGRVSPSDFVIVDDGKGLLLINTNAGEVVLGSARKQSS
jgi:hypothetical protein